MVKRIFSAYALVLLTNTAAQAGLCVPPTVDKNSPYRYLVSVANALVYAKEGLARVDDSDSKGGAYSLLVALKLQQSDFRCAGSQVAPYAASSDTLIESSARATAGIFRRLSDLNDELASQCKALLDSSDAVTPGTFAER